MALLLYPAQLVVAAAVLHCVAILCTIFRLVYRAWTSRLWWEDAWAALALIFDVLCLACDFIADESITSWTLISSFASVLWAARISVVFSIVRIIKYSMFNSHKQITYVIIVSFICMWAAILAQKLSACMHQHCEMTRSVAISQLITDLIADVSLVAVPLYLWKNVGLSRSRKILVLSAFGSSLLITAITIPHSIILFRAHSPNTLIFAHVKAALSLIICNLLVIVTFAYRVCSRGRFDVEQSLDSNEVLTSVVVMPGPDSTAAGMSISLRERTTSRQIMTVQAGTTTELKIEDADLHYVEDGTGIEGCLEISKDGKE